VTVLWHGEEPIGVCVFCAPPKSLRQRTRYFGLSGRWSRWRLQSLNAQMAHLSRVVLHPTYRGAGLAADFVRASCRSCRWPWIETLAEMGRVHPFFEKAGFVRVGSSSGRRGTRGAHSALYVPRPGRNPRRRLLLSRESHEKSRYAEPVYYVFDNRESCHRRGAERKRGGSQEEAAGEDSGAEA
jgi:hypothetical protein